MPIDYKVTNTNDSKAMGSMLRRAKTILRSTEFTALYDKGYHTGSELATADSLGIEAIVAIPAISGASRSPEPAYDVQNFVYDEKQDAYVCPQGQILKSNGRWYEAGNKAYRFQQYKTPACHSCPVQSRCTRSKQNGKIVQRSEYTRYIEENRKRVSQNEKTYKRRQAIVEHPYGTIKRQWGYNYIITKKFRERAEADCGLIFTAYKLRRIINLMGINRLFEAIGQFFTLFRLKHGTFSLYLHLIINNLSQNSKNETLLILHEIY